MAWMRSVRLTAGTQGRRPDDGCPGIGILARAGRSVESSAARAASDTEAWSNWPSTIVCVAAEGCRRMDQSGLSHAFFCLQ
jgi:hypothetical protein